MWWRWAPWALFSGVLLMLSFPRPDLHLLVWVALVPMVLVAREASARRRWCAGFVTGFVWRATSLYWITHVMVTYGGMSTPVGLAVTGLLAFWMALNTGLFCLLVPYALRRGVPGAVLLAAVWVSLEYLQTLLPFGFPWSLLGYAAGRTLLLMQAADLAGVWGLSFLAVFVNVAIAQRISRGRSALPLALVAATPLPRPGRATYALRIFDTPRARKSAYPGQDPGEPNSPLPPEIEAD